MIDDVNNGLGVAISRLPRVDTFSVQSVLRSTFTKHDALNSVTGASLLLALHRAREAQELAVSYRDFRVGAAVMYFAYSPPTMQILSGINIKPEKESAINVHAEQLALQKIKDLGGDVISLIVVVGELQADTQSGRLATTLQPCGLCRDKLDRSGLVVDDGTIVVSALPDLRTMEMQLFGSLKLFHANNDDSGILRINLPEMDLLKPFKPSTNTPYALKESTKQDTEEAIWFQKIEVPLSTFRQTGSFLA